MYEYHIIPIHQDYRGRNIKKMSISISEQVSETLNNHGGRGWDFYRMDQVTVYKPPGCIGWLFGWAGETTFFNLIIFRRKALF